MRQIAINIETFSPAPLEKTGVYPYAEHPDFRLLIFGYSIDGGPVEVVDLASGGRLPDELLAAGFLDPSQWRCTMVWSAYLGLPMSLDTVGAALTLTCRRTRRVSG